MDPAIWKTRAVIVHRDDNNGYGLTVSGDNPVNVQTIKKDGAADRAGIREGDIIVKVNGTLVEHMNHTEVVNLIRAAGPYVTLTVKPTDLVSMPGVGFTGGGGSGRLQQIAANDRVTAPLPVNQEIQQQLQGNKLRTLQAMRDKAQADVEKLWKKYEMTQSPRDMSDFEKAQQGLKRIESQMKSFRQSTPNLQLHTPAPFNSYPQLHQPVPFQPHPHHGNSSGSPILGGPPGRHRNPMSQQSIPPYENVRWGDDEPPPLPPRSYPHPVMCPPPAMDNASTFSPPPGYSPHDPLAQVYSIQHPPGEIGVLGPYPSNSFKTNIPSSQTSFPRTSISCAPSYPPSPITYHRPSSSPTHMVNLGNTSGSSPGPHLLQQTHHRAKSSPDPVAMQKALSCAEGSRRADSVNDVSKSNSLNSKSRSSAAWDSVDATSNHLNSPPGSPPPPYGRHSDNDSSGFDDSSHTPSGSVNISSLDIFSPKSAFGALNNRPSSNPAVDIISMEEDDGLLSGDVVLPSVSGKQGPYSSLSKLLEHNAHLAVFINYVIDNRLDPSSLLFYLITGLNLEDGSIKEMKRWCYEIHSTFTAPGAPLLIPNVAESIAAEIDDGLLHESDKGEMMRRVFRKARNKAKEEINKQLEEFCNKRIAGLGSMFGPPDNQLEESINDPVKQLKIVETYLLPRLDQFHDDYEKNQDDKTMAIVNAIATVLNKQFGIRNQQSASSVIDRCPSFVSKEKSIKSKWMSKHKKVTLSGHHLTPQYYYSYTECNICSKLLWGVGPQGYQCVDCHVNIHRTCMSHIQDNCLGTGQRKEKANDKFWKLKERIRPVQEQRRRISAKKNSDDSNSFLSGDLDPGDRPLAGSGSSASNLKGDRRPDTLNEERLENDGHICEEEEMDRVRHEPKRTTNAVGRSESCKEPQRKQPRERRKHSDPNLTSKSSDVDLDTQRLSSDANNSGSSSNSSLSARSLDSPNTSSLELVNHYRARDSETPENPTRHSEIVSDSSFSKIPPGWEGDSDIEIEQDPPDWTKDVPEATLSRLDRLEKKRQEVLNELFHTERLYVRKLKIMDRLFFRPMKNQQLLLSSQLIDLLFPNLEEILDIHDQFNVSLKRVRTESSLVGDIGPVLLEMFDGERGEQLRLAAAKFCARQQIGLEQLREKRKRDMKFHAFLTEAESNPVCRRLGIKDMIPTVMQRLTKYPLLFESLCNCTAADSTEYKNLQRALELSKEILCSVNAAKKEAEDEERLDEIQRRLDKSYFEKGVERTDHSYNDLRNFDFTRHKLMHDGDLVWRLQKPKGDRLKSENQDVLLVLLEDMIVLLLKVDDRYVLKMHNVGMGKADRMSAKPIIKLNTLHATRVAADKRAFYLLSKSSPTPFMFELGCSTGEERTSWLQHISRAADDYKNRQESRRSETHPIGSIPPSVSESEDKSIETDEVTESAVGEQATETGAQQEPSAAASNKDSSSIPESNLGNNNVNTSGGGGDTSPQSPEKSATGDGAKSGQAPTPDRRKQGEFLRVTESSPLIDPSEVVVETTEVHFAKIICSPYEELKRCDSKIHMAFDEKLKIISKLCHIPPEGAEERVVEELADTSSNSSSKGTPKDAKELVAACIHQVDQLGRLVASQKVTSENIQHQKEQLGIHKVLNSLLAQLLNEVHRKDEDLELRRQELYRIREQNHGYQERLQAKAKMDQTSLVSPVHSPTQSRPNSFNSHSSSDHHECAHDDETEVVGKAPLKPQLSAPVASSSSNSTNDLPISVTSTTSISNPTDDTTISCTTTNTAAACDPVIETDANQELSSSQEVVKRSSSAGPGPNYERNSASESAPEEFADALEDVVTTDWDSGIETNRESTETEVVAPTNEITSPASCQQQKDSVLEEPVTTESSSQISKSKKEEQDSSNCTNVPENRTVNEGQMMVVGQIDPASTKSQESLANGHAISSSSPGGGDNNNASLEGITSIEKCNTVGRDPSSSAPVPEETQKS